MILLLAVEYFILMILMPVAEDLMFMLLLLVVQDLILMILWGVTLKSDPKKTFLGSLFRVTLSDLVHKPIFLLFFGAFFQVMNFSPFLLLK